ncbi:30S ribosomal protein S2 [Mycoplasma sp. 3341]|uniref:30S ribosomal protein S2 n=1 Tax=Mycoplasma sp. 3341 TaxID=3447506 RepID=UPI003F65D5A7
MENKNQETKAPVQAEAQKEIVSRSKLLEAGTYFGHRASAWNPKMKPYLYQKRQGIHVIDIAKTQKSLEYAYKMIQRAAQKGASFIFVGTKKQAKQAVEEQAKRVNSPYVAERWLGGTLTNSDTIFKSVNLLSELEAKQAGGYVGYTKKEGLNFDKKIAKLQRNLSGIRHMKKIPNVMIVASPLADEIAIKEAHKKGVKVFGILDSNADPDAVDFGIPANDDSVKSITLILTILADAIATGRGQNALFAYQNDDAIVLPEDPKKEVANDQPKRNFRRPNNSKGE